MSYNHLTIQPSNHMNSISYNHLTMQPSNHFNSSPPTLMHIDLNSCFATVEQQANPLLRGKPVAVAAYTTGNGCILAPSVEAKRFGVKTGMRVRDGKALCPSLIVLPSDPWKYRFVNRKLLALTRGYTADVEVKSIDEMVLDMTQSQVLYGYMVRWSKDQEKVNNHLTIQPSSHLIVDAMLNIGREIKQRIKAEIGDWLTVSVGIAPNRFLAKAAAGLHKPDGLDVINAGNVEKILFGLQLEDLCGIKEGNGGRLRLLGIQTTKQFYDATIADLERAFHSVVGRHWWMRLHGYEIDDRQFGRKSFGHSYALYKPYAPDSKEFAQIMTQLTAKTGRRLRANHYTAQGIHVSLLYSDGSYWHEGKKLAHSMFTDADVYRAAVVVMTRAPVGPVKLAAISCMYLSHDLYAQQSLFPEDRRKTSVTQAMDTIADRWGDFTVKSGRMLGMETNIMDRIAFGGVAGLEEFVFTEDVQADRNLLS